MFNSNTTTTTNYNTTTTTITITPTTIINNNSTSNSKSNIFINSSNTNNTNTTSCNSNQINRLNMAECALIKSSQCFQDKNRIKKDLTKLTKNLLLLVGTSHFYLFFFTISTLLPTSCLFCLYLCLFYFFLLSFFSPHSHLPNFYPSLFLSFYFSFSYLFRLNYKPIKKNLRLGTCSSGISGWTKMAKVNSTVQFP